jgi:O-antigen ligase
MYTVDYAHNDYLQVMAELGLLGFIAGLALLLRVLWTVLRAALEERALDVRYRAIACAGAFTAILLHSFVDFNLYMPANAMLLAWIAGIQASSLRAPSHPPSSPLCTTPPSSSFTPC